MGEEVPLLLSTQGLKSKDPLSSWYSKSNRYGPTHTLYTLTYLRPVVDRHWTLSVEGRRGWSFQPTSTIETESGRLPPRTVNRVLPKSPTSLTSEIRVRTLQITQHLPRLPPWLQNTYTRPKTWRDQKRSPLLGLHLDTPTLLKTKGKESWRPRKSLRCDPECPPTVLLHFSILLYQSGIFSDGPLTKEEHGPPFTGD